MRDVSDTPVALSQIEKIHIKHCYFVIFIAGDNNQGESKFYYVMFKGNSYEKLKRSLSAGYIEDIEELGGVIILQGEGMPDHVQRKYMIDKYDFSETEVKIHITHSELP